MSHNRGGNLSESDRILSAWELFLKNWQVAIAI